MQTADVVVVGAGANGLSTAFHLARAGVKRVVVVERRHLAAGATGKSGALVRMHYTNEPETRLAFESLRYFQNWRHMVGGECGFQPVGLLVFVPPAFRDHLEANVAMHRRIGVNACVIPADEAHQCSAERWRIEGAFTEGGVHTTMPPLVGGQETEMWQAVCGSATTGGIDHLEERVPTMTEAPVNTTTKLL
jgi:glycine/D-amino acid oxidase-like deaminating enzyme